MVVCVSLGKAASPANKPPGTKPNLPFAGDVAEDVPRLLINRERVGHSRAAKALEGQQEEMERRRRLKEASSAVSSSSTSEAGSPQGDDDDDEDDEDRCGSSSGYESDGSSGCDSGSDSSGGSGMSCGFEFGLPGNRRDAVHLGNTDDAVRQLAALLGWSEELEALIQADAKARAEAADEAEQ